MAREFLSAMKEIHIDDIWSKKVNLPKGLVLEDSPPGQSIVFRLQGLKMEDMKTLEGFVLSVVGDIPPVEKYPLLQVGNYLVAMPVIQDDSLFGGSIIKINRYNPLAKHVAGTGVIVNHPSYEFPAEWGLGGLLAELREGFWIIMNEQDMKAYAQSKGLVIQYG